MKERAQDHKLMVWLEHYQRNSEKDIVCKAWQLGK